MAEVHEFDIAVGFSQRLKGMNIKGFSHILYDVAKAWNVLSLFNPSDKTDGNLKPTATKSG